MVYNLFWSGIKVAVTGYANSCHTCQMAGKPNSLPAPIIPVPVTSEPSERAIIDCVDPLLKAKKGNE